MNDTDNFEQLELDLSTPEPTEYHIQLRKGDLHNTEQVKSAVVQRLDQVANIVEGYRNHAIQANDVTWKEDRVVTGFLGGLAPGGVVWEITISPAITIDA